MKAINVFDKFVNNPKRYLVPLFIIICILILGGIGFKLFAKTDHTITFKQDVVIEYKDNFDSISLIDKVGGKDIKEEWVDHISNTITIKGWSVTATKVDTSSLGRHEVTFTTSDVGQKNKFTSYVTVEDRTAPTIKLKKDEFEIKEEKLEDIDLKGMLNDYIKVNDNYTEADKIRIEFDMTADDLEIGKNVVTISATDEFDNTSTAEITITVKEKKKEEPKKEENKNTSSSDDGGGYSAPINNEPAYTPPTQDYSYTVPACSYASFYESTYGDLISAYNAAESYYSSCSGSAALMPINDAEGNTIGWSVG